MVIAALLRLREEGPVLAFASSMSSLLLSRSGWSHARVTQSGVATRPSSRLYVLAGNRAAHILTLSLSKSMIYMDVCKKFCKRFFCKKNCCTEIMQKKGLWPFSSPEPLGLICNRQDHVTKKRRALGTKMNYEPASKLSRYWVPCPVVVPEISSASHVKVLWSYSRTRTAGNVFSADFLNV